jgi:hypothetical protein
MPGDIVGVNDRGGWHGPMKHVCDAGLSASAAAIHGQNPRSVMTVSVSVDTRRIRSLIGITRHGPAGGSPGPSFMFISKSPSLSFAERPKK